MKTYTVKGWDGFMEWNGEYYTFEAENDTEAEKIAEEWFNEEYLPDILSDPQSYSYYPDRNDYETEEDYEDAITQAEEELSAELMWEFVEEEE